MSSPLFLRKVQVSVGLRGAPALLIEDLRIVFKVEKTLDKTPNNALIEIYNLSPSHRAVFEKPGTAIRLVAGYVNSVKDIFLGDIGTVITQRSGTDIITKVEAADGLLAYQSAEADLSFAPGTKVGTILDSLTTAFGLAKGEVSGVDLNDEYLNGATFSGKVQSHLDTLLGKQRDVAWSIQNGVIQILPKAGGSSKAAILLSPETGLIGSPFKRTVLNLDIAKKVEGKEAQNGVTAKSLLNASISPGRLIQVKAQFVNGIFKTDKVTHQGDTHAVSYYSDVEGIDVR